MGNKNYEFFHKIIINKLYVKDKLKN